MLHSNHSSPNLKLPYILAAQAQKHITHNEAIRTLDALVQISVHSRSLVTPPNSPTEGTSYIVGLNAENEWEGQAGNIAVFQDGAWIFLEPLEGWVVWISDEHNLFVMSSTGWMTVGENQATASGSINDNYLINGDFKINQREFSGGILEAGTYGFDRWKAGASGAEINLINDDVHLTNGLITQTLENPDLAGQTVTISVENLTDGELSVTIGSQATSISPGEGRVSASVNIPSSDEGDLNISLSPAADGVKFSKVKLERGIVATEWSPRPLTVELALAQRYYERISGQSGDRYIRRSYGTNTGPHYYPVQFFARKRVAPDVNLIQINNSNSTNAQAFNPSLNEFEFYHSISTAGGYTYFGYEADAEL